MTQDEIIELARQAGLHVATDVNWMPVIGLDYAKKLIELAAAKEREACAELRKTLSAIPNHHVPQLQPAVESALDFYAERIRARGQA